MFFMTAVLNCLTLSHMFNRAYFAACNMISLFPGGLFTMRNYGMRLNCSMLAIYPQKITFSLADVGVNRRISESSLQLAPAERAPYNQVSSFFRPVLRGK